MATWLESSRSAEYSPAILSRTLEKVSVSLGSLDYFDEGAFYGETIIVGGFLNTNLIMANSIVANHIASGAITADKVQAGAITADKLNVTSLSAISGNIGTITSGKITGTEINNGNGTFSVSTSGDLKATNADITGKVNATSGSFTGSITSTNATITGGSINITTSDDYYNVIKLSSPNVYSIAAPGQFMVRNSEGYFSDIQGHAAYFGSYSGGLKTHNVFISCSSGQIHAKGSIFTDNSIQATGSIIADDKIKAKGTIITDNSIQAKRLTAGDQIYTGYMLSIYGGDAYIGGDFGVSGTKQRIVSTKNYGDVGLNAYETPRPTFADTGHANIAVDGFCYIDIDSIFLETIDTTHDYTYFLTQYGQGNLWVRKDLSTKEYFVVEGTPNLDFSWKIEAVQKGYNTYNLEKFETNKEKPEEVNYFDDFKDEDYEELADNYLRDYEKELIP